MGVFSLTGYTRLGTFQPLPASPQYPTGLTPNPSPRGEGSEMLCLLHACYWLTCYPPTHPQHPSASNQPLPASPQAPTGLTPSPSPRGEGSDMLCLLHACYLSTGQLPNHSSTSQSLVFLLTWHIANCSFVHFSAIFLTRRVPFLSTNCSPCRKKSILAEVCFKAKRS